MIECLICDRESDYAVCEICHDIRVATLTAERDEAQADNQRLREALRKYGINVSDFAGISYLCKLCHGFWDDGQPEHHAPGCLAAPKEKE